MKTPAKRTITLGVALVLGVAYWLTLQHQSGSLPVRFAAAPTQEPVGIPFQGDRNDLTSFTASAPASPRPGLP